MLFAEGVGLEWISEGKRRFVLAPHLSLKERILLFQGETFFSQLLAVQYEKEPYSLTGYFGDLYSYRSQRTHDYLFLNRKFVQNKEIFSMIVEAYATRLPERKYPPFVCNLALPSGSFDRNVHPQKKEVRLKDPEALRHFFVEAIHHLFQPGKKTQSITFPRLPLTSGISPPLFERKEEEKKQESQLEKIELVKQFGSYAIFEKERVLYLISLRRASQYLLEKKFAQMKKQERLESQKLLIPISYRCSYEEAELLEKKWRELAKIWIYLPHAWQGSLSY